MRFEGLLDRQTRGEITQEEAATVLGVSVRTFQRWAERYEEDGADGLKDGRLNRPSPKRAPREELERMLCLFRDKYSDFTVKHFHEQLVKRHSYYLGYTVTKLTLHAAGLVRPAKKRSAHRKKRPRRPVPGMMLHQASPEWQDRASPEIWASSPARRNIPAQSLAGERRVPSFWFAGWLRVADPFARREQLARVADLAFCSTTASASTASMAISRDSSAAAISDR
jgi:transposase